jgi:hypothetical protein
MQEVHEFRTEVKLILLDKLYAEQLLYWNKRLMKVQRMNASAHGRYGSVYQIFYNNQIWKTEFLHWTNEKPSSKLCLGLHPGFPQFEREMVIISDEMGEILEEKYEADRLISGLVTFSFTQDVIQEILGDTLYDTCKDILLRNRFACEKGWGGAAQASLSTFVMHNQRVLRQLNERILVNLITLDASKQL